MSLAVAIVARAQPAQAQTVPVGIAQVTHGLARIDGFLPLYWDNATGKLWLEIPRLDTDLIYQTYLPAGMGSNDIGLDRGQLGETRIVRFVRSGPKVLMIEPNQMFRSDSSDADERRAVSESFAQSVLWGFTVGAESDGRILVDATAFALHDAHGVAQTLKDAKQGTYRLDDARSAIDSQHLKAFPRNTVIDAILTFAGDDPGQYVRDVTPTPQAITVRERQEFIALPEPGFVPRRNDPRAGYFNLRFVNDTAALGTSIENRFIYRHRLVKKNPRAAVSEPVAPLVYYVDRGAPEPIRTALLEGARWWSTAFESAGYRNAFRVELLPPGADPLDVRYNVIEWVHRATRGWSMGTIVADPRTGEIIQGHVTLGSLRMRQDWLIGEGLLSPYDRGDEQPAALTHMVLARLRQLAAHETGHTLGLEHNFLASAQGRASVMDYPPPVVGLTGDGHIDVHDAYATGIGAWDTVAIAYGYGDFGPESSAGPALDAVLAGARARGLTLLTDQDARPPGSAHPQAHLWDSGADAVSALEREMAVRKAALARFGERTIRSGMPLATMEEALVPLYLHHRYQAEAAIKSIGGVWYAYALRGDGQEAPHPVAAAQQERALQAVLATVTPNALALPSAVLDRLPPRPASFEPTRELFSRYTGLIFDSVSPAASAANLTFSLLLNPERAARLVEQHARDSRLPGWHEVLDRTSRAVFAMRPSSGYAAEIARAVQRALVERLMDVASNAPMPQVRAEATLHLRDLRNTLMTHPSADRAQHAHQMLIADDIGRFMTRTWAPPAHAEPLVIPPGQPIGDDEPR